MFRSLAEYPLRYFLTGIVLLATLPLAVLALYISLRTYEHESEDIRTTLDHAIAVASSNQVRAVEEARVLLRHLSGDDEFRNADRALCDRYLQGLLPALPQFAMMGRIDMKGNLECAGLPMKEPVNLAFRSFFKRAVETRDFAIGEYQIGKLSGRPSLNFGMPLFDDKGVMTGVAVVAVDILHFHRLLVDSLPRQGATLTLLSDKGDVFARHPDPEKLVGKALPDAKLLQNISLAERGSLVAEGLDGVERVYAFARISRTPTQTLYLTIGIPIAEAAEDARHALLWQIGGLVVVSGLALFVAWRVARHRLDRMGRLTRFAGALQNGDFSVRSDLASGRDEVARIASAFNDTAAALELREIERRRGIETIERLNRELEERVVERTGELSAARLALEERNTVLRDALRAQERQSGMLTRMGTTSELLQACLSVDEAYDIVLRHLRGLCSPPAGGIYLIRDSRNLAQRVVEWGDHPPILEFEPKDCWALRRGTVHRAAQDGPQPRCRHDAGDNGDSLCLPMVAQGEVLGMIHLRYSPGGLAAVDEDALDALRALADQAGQSIANLRLRERLRAQSIRDPLTDLYNRRYLEETLDREQRRALRSGEPMALLMTDIDFFKKVNDTHGHDVGDVILAGVARILRQGVRGEDVAGRYGGEEFLLVLPGTGKEGALVRAEALRKAVEAASFTHGDAVVGGITLSIGLAVLPDHGQDWAEVLRAADAALYRAKREGRNRVLAA